jgi:hypothetical protein
MIGAVDIAPGLEVTERAEKRTFFEINDSPVNGNQADTVVLSPPSFPASTAATVVMAGGVQATRPIRLARQDADEIMLMLEKTMEKVCTWSEWIEA